LTLIEIYKHIIVKNKRPEQIYDWFTCLTLEKFRQWYPGIHLNIKVKESGLKIGDTLLFEVLLDGTKKQLIWKVIDLQYNMEIVSKLKSFYPVRVHLLFKHYGNDTEVVYNLKVGFHLFGIERLLDCFVSKFILTEKKIEAIKFHEEAKFKNLENLIC